MSDTVPFQKGDWVIDRNNPGRPGIFTGKTQRQGPFLLAELEYGPGDRRLRPVDYLQAAPRYASGSLAERLGKGTWGRLADIQRLLTFEKLRGTLHDIIYSMEAAQIDFFPYQFKPVLKFIDSPTERMVIADEVGLGKTIEAALIWIELQARKQARRLLVLCPTHILAKKWREELRTKFIIDARMVSFAELRTEIDELKRAGPPHSFALVATYSGLRPPRTEHVHLDDTPGETAAESPKTQLCQELRAWELDYEPFDLVIFDEAHHMRNAGTANFRLGESLSRNSGAVLCVSAIPVNNRNEDLHTLLRLVDEEFFRNQTLFSELIESNRPAVQLANALARVPVDQTLFQQALQGLAQSRFVGQSPLFKLLLERVEKMDWTSAADAAECQQIAEKLNLLGSYVNRTRRVQVKEHRPVRETMVLEVQYSPQEMQLYRAVVDLVRRSCEKDQRTFHIFQVIGLQMRSASSLPVLAAEIRSGKLGNPFELLAEGFGAPEEDDDAAEDASESEWDLQQLQALMAFDFEVNDSKFAKLEDLILRKLIGEKLVIFSFYRGTLGYLERRLARIGVKTVLIHGGIEPENRDDLLEAFRTRPDVQVLLSSEVGSEGIDLQQSCRVMVNYDLPWNPMRVEQRIGRIDRVGQKAQKLAIVHFKVKDTIEERIFTRLHHRLELFANSLGDLEPVIGRIVQELTVDLLSNRLTPEMEERRIDEAERIIENRLRDLRVLEESGETLIALSDYVQKKIDEDRGRGRFIQPSELERYLADFFNRNFQGSYLEWNTPADGCMRLRLSNQAQTSLGDFIRDDRSLAAAPLRQRELSFTFRRDVHQNLASGRRREIHFLNHLSPLVRWITAINKDSAEGFFSVSALQLTEPGWPKGVWVYRVERWMLQGLRSQEQLAYAALQVGQPEPLVPSQAEQLLQTALRAGRDWSYPVYSANDLQAAHQQLEAHLAARFDEAIGRFRAENVNTFQIRKERALNLFDRRIEQDRQRLSSLRQNQRSEQAIRLTEARLRKAEENRQRKMDELTARSQVDVDKSEIAAGIINTI